MRSTAFSARATTNVPAAARKVSRHCKLVRHDPSRHRLRVDTSRAGTQCKASKTGVVSDAWSNAAAYCEGGLLYETKVLDTNAGGVCVDCWGYPGFVPNSMLERLKSDVGPEVGAPIAVMFVEVDSAKNRMILSQKQLPKASLITELAVGSTVQGTVTWIEAYGVFVDVEVPGGTVPGMIHKSELSWGAVVVPDSITAVGEMVKCKVIGREVGKRRVSLSLKQVTPDPLKQNVETILESGGAEVKWEEGSDPLPRLQEVVAKLLDVEGITEVKLGRQGSVPGLVTQDFELWLSTEQMGDHWVVVARSGSCVQELEVYSSLDKQELKACFDKVKA